MVCIYCRHETQVVNSRHQKKANQVWRRRKCTNCSAIFSTQEAVDYASVWLVKDSKTAKAKQQPFSRDHLFLSILDSLKHRRKTAVADAGAITDTVIAKLSVLEAGGVFEASTIAQITQVALNRFDTVASVHYQAYRQ